MDNNNFEQQFTQNVKSTMPQPAMETPVGSSKLPLIIALALAAITLVESIVLIIAFVNFFGEDTSEEIINEDISVEENNYYQYDNDGNLVSLNLTCTAEDGAKYVLTNSKTYEHRDASGSVTNSGDYSIVNDSLVSLTSSNGNKVLYYDWVSLADELTLYDCDEDSGATSSTE